MCKVEVVPSSELSLLFLIAFGHSFPCTVATSHRNSTTSIHVAHKYLQTLQNQSGRRLQSAQKAARSHANPKSHKKGVRTITTSSEGVHKRTQSQCWLPYVHDAYEMPAIVR